MKRRTPRLEQELVWTPKKGGKLRLRKVPKIEVPDAAVSGFTTPIRQDEIGKGYFESDQWPNNSA